MKKYIPGETKEQRKARKNLAKSNKLSKNTPPPKTISTVSTNNKIAFVEYVQDMTETTMPSFFVEALVAKVATEINEAITASGSLTQRLASDFQQKLRAARIADGQENPPQNIMPAGRLIEAHLNGSTSDRFRHEQS